MMKKLTIADLLSLETYDEKRSSFRRKMQQHKEQRRLAIGDRISLYFEDCLTMQYQVQEMLYAEKIFTKNEIQQELDAYNPLIPDGDNWKATMMIEYDDRDQRARELKKLTKIENCVYVQIQGIKKIYAIANEDLDRDNTDKASAVNFLRFQFNSAAMKALKNKAPFKIGIDHPQYNYEIDDFSDDFLKQLMADLNF